MSDLNPFERQLEDAYRREPVPSPRAPLRSNPGRTVAFELRSRTSLFVGGAVLLFGGGGTVALVAGAAGSHRAVPPPSPVVAARRPATPAAAGRSASPPPAPPPAVYTGPAPPPSYRLDTVVPPAAGVVVLSEIHILVGDVVTATPTGPVPAPLTVDRSANGRDDEFDIRWVPGSADRWDWQDGPPVAVAAGNRVEHRYTSVSGAGAVPAAGVTVSMTRRWVPQCRALVRSAGVVVGEVPWGAFACPFPAGTSAASYSIPQTFSETTPPAPHRIFQIEPVG